MNRDTTYRIKTLLKHEIDWTRVLSTAYRHGLIPLVYWHLKGTAFEAVPQPVLNKLRIDFHKNAGRNLFQAEKLLELLNSFGAAGIIAIPYKGPTLTASIYRNLGLRQFVDLDILVRPRDVAKVTRLLVSRGYRREPALIPAQEPAFSAYHCEYMFRHTNKPLNVEIQWNISPQYFALSLDLEAFWSRLQPVSVLGTQVLTLSPEDLLLVLCVHGTKHRWEQLKWVCDIAELIRCAERLDWQRVLAHARSTGSERMLLLGLMLARDLLGAALPEEVSRRVQADPAVISLVAQVVGELFRDHDNQPTLWDLWLFHLRARERLRDRARYCLRLALTPTVGDWNFLPLPGPLFPLYHLLRPIRLARDWLKRTSPS